MSRDLTPTTTSSLDDDVVYPFFAVELLFDSEPVRMWTGQGSLSANGNTYIGLGQILNVSSVEETAEISVKGATITLSGVTQDLVALALNETYQGRVCNIYFGMTGEQVLNQIFSGYMDQMNIADGGETSTIELKVENKLVDLERPKIARFTSGYQKSVYPNDKGLDFVEDLQDKKIAWGRASED